MAALKGASCAGSSSSGQYPGYYVAQNYAQYNSATVSLAGNQNTVQPSLYITTVPVVMTPVGRRGGVVR